MKSVRNKIMKILLVVLIVLICVFGIYAQVKNEFLALNGPYLGQKPPGMLPEIFASEISSTEAFEFAITFSNDGNDIFFTRRPTYEGGGNSIMHTYHNNENWIKPKLASFAKSGYVELEPFCALDESKVYFHSEREHPATKKWLMMKKSGSPSKKIMNVKKLPFYLEFLIQVG